VIGPRRSVGRVVVALVEDHDPDGPGLLGVEGLLPERAGPALDEGDRALFEAGEVGRRAAALGPAGRGDDDAATAWRGAVTSPLPEYDIVMKSSSA
jgi:hypothetical protein